MGGALSLTGLQISQSSLQKSLYCFRSSLWLTGSTDRTYWILTLLVKIPGRDPVAPQQGWSAALGP